MSKQSVIYLISWTNNHYFYIGQAQNLQRRSRQHVNSLNKGKHLNGRLQRVFNKYGAPNFHVLEEIVIDKLDEREQFYLDLLFDLPECLNLAKDVKVPTKGLKLSEQHKQKLSKATKGNKHWLFGGKHSEASKVKMSEAKKGRTLSNETKQKISKANKGNKCSEYVKAKISKANKIKILQYSLSGEFICEWNSATDASRELKILNTSICNCCKNKRKTAGGFIWKYKS